jgi:hypothetical protein
MTVSQQTSLNEMPVQTLPYQALADDLAVRIVRFLAWVGVAVGVLRILAGILISGEYLIEDLYAGVYPAWYNRFRFTLSVGMGLLGLLSLSASIGCLKLQPGAGWLMRFSEKLALVLLFASLCSTTAFLASRDYSAVRWDHLSTWSMLLYYVDWYCTGAIFPVLVLFLFSLPGLKALVR